MGLLSKILSKKQANKIECCSTNINLFYSDEDLDQFEDFADANGIEIKEMQCLDNCEECPVSAYAVYNGKKVFAETPEAVLCKIDQLLKNTDN